MSGLRSAAALLAVAGAVLLAGLWPRGAEPPNPNRRQLAALQAAWHVFLDGLQHDAERASARLTAAGPVVLDSPSARQHAFEALEEASEANGRTLLLIDPGGTVEVWGGPGLRHDLPLRDLPGEGIGQVSGFTAVSLYAVAPVPVRTGEDWRMVAGSSFPTDALPVRPPFGLRRHGVRWSVRSAAAEPVNPALEATGVHELESGSGGGEPWLRVRFGPRLEPSGEGAAWTALGLLVLAAGLAMRPFLLRRAAGSVGGMPPDGRRAPWRRAATFTCAAGLAAVGLYLWQRLARGMADAPPDLAESMVGSPNQWLVLFASWAALAFGGLHAIEWRQRTDWIQLVAVGAAAALGVGVLAEAVRPFALAATLSEQDGEALDSPTPAAIEALAEATGAALEGLDLADLALGESADVEDHQDLALALWRASPLARSGTLSALAVEREGRVVSVFSYGLPLDSATGYLALESERWPASELPRWQEERSAAGEVVLSHSGQRWGVARYWSLALPRTVLWPEEQTTGGDVEVQLLRGGPGRDAEGVGEPPGRLSGRPLIAWVDGAGRPLASPWQQDWRLPPPSEVVNPSRRHRVATPAGTARAWFHPTSSTGIWVVALLPDAPGLERAWRGAIVGARVILGLAVAALVLLLVTLPAAALRDGLVAWVKRYSVRLALVMALIAILPLTLLNGFLFRNLADRVRLEQEAAGHAALVSLEHILTDFLLGLEAGYSMDAQLDDELLAWLAEAVGHEVKLYWRGGVLASSKPDLFAAGLMPKRIPGAVYARLALLGHPTATRTRSAAGGASYLELYRPVSMGEERPAESGLFVSVALLAQQEEATRDLAALERRSLVVTASLVLILVLVGARLARGFTRPLMRMIDGAGRIAGGAESLGFVPEEAELRTLAGAIDGMAARIASTRRREEAEKRLLEGVVENITSGVVSLDAEGRATMMNRNASRLLGVEVGDCLETAGSAPGLDAGMVPVADLVRDRSSRIEQVTLTVGSGEERREWTVFWVPVAGEGDPAALLVLEDVTDVARAQRLEAWAQMARLIAHEVKNPLTPIRLSTQHLRQVWRDAPERLQEVFDRCTDNILAQVEELARTAGEFSTYSRIPLARLEMDDLAEAVEEVVDGYASGAHAAVEVRFTSEVEKGAAVIPFDRKQIQRALRNLIENSVRASGEAGEVEVRVEAADDGKALAVTVVDRGPGVSQEDLERIFEPYFSTSSGGTGLGLPIARRIVREHGGTISAAVRPEGGLRIRITLAGPGSASGGENPG